LSNINHGTGECLVKKSQGVQEFFDLLSPEKLTSIVDIGASPITGKPPYFDLLKSERSNITGFEPDEKAFADLMSAKGNNETYFQYAVGDGGDKTYYATPATGLASTKKLSSWVGDYFGPWWRKQAARAAEIQFSTKRLDDFETIRQIDFLKIDIQGGELEVFENATRLMRTVCMVQTEIALMSFYDGQPSFADIQRELERSGLIAFSFSTINRRRIFSKFGSQLGLKVRPTQVLDLDVIFIRNPTELHKSETEQIKQLAVLAFSVLGANDLVFKCLDILDERGSIELDEIKSFFQLEN
jgi:FkbM family methyltransferase